MSSDLCQWLSENLARGCLLLNSKYLRGWDAIERGDQERPGRIIQAQKRPQPKLPVLGLEGDSWGPLENSAKLQPI